MGFLKEAGCLLKELPVAILGADMDMIRFHKSPLTPEGGQSVKKTAGSCF